MDDNDILQEQGARELNPEMDLVKVAAVLEDKDAIAELEKSKVALSYNDAVRRMLDRAAGREVPVPLPWNSLNDALGGGLWSGLHILVAASGVGKSQWSLQATEAACLAGIPVLYIGLELDKMGLIARLLGLRAQCQWGALYLGSDPKNLGRADLEHRLTISSWPLYIEVSPPMGWHYQELHRKVGALRALHRDGPCLIVLDYLQLVTGNKNEDLRERIRQASYAARAAARDHHASVLLISSVAREHYPYLTGQKRVNDLSPGEGNPARFLGVGKESGEIEYAADSVLVLCQDGIEDSNNAVLRNIYLGIAKQRAGLTRWVPLQFDGNRFSDPDNSVPPNSSYQRPSV